jgi:tape measure domain-containing protein
MSGVDQRIVEMAFKGDSFLTGVKNSLSALAQLKNGLNGLKGSEQQINNLDSAGKRFSLAGMASGLDSIKSKFSAMGVVGITAIANLTNRTISAGITMAKALTIDPIKAGLDVYETKINAIQTILANTSSEGTNLKQVTAALDQLNQYANLTVYNFGEMAKNIGTFTAAGVNLQTSVSSIKGIANLAALSGSSADQASTAMYQLSQAIAAGVVKLQDWNSVVNAGLGGKVFQNALEETARASGVAIDSIIKKAGSFRNSLQQGWLTSDILTKTLATFTGDLSNAQLRAMGFTAQEAEAIQKQAKLAVNSATQIRTVSQLFQALKEEVATAWSHVFEAIIGNIGQATTTLSALHSAAENALTAPIYKLAQLLESFRKLGGFNLIIDGIKNSFHALSLVLSTIGAAFHAVFPSNGGGPAEGLIKIATAFDNFTKKLTPSKQTLTDIKTILEGLFSVVKIVIDVISALFGAFGKVGGAATGASGGFLHLIANVVSLITKFREFIESSNLLQKVFQVLGTIISFPVKVIGALISKLGGLGGAATGATSAVGGFVSKVGDEFKKLADAIVNGIKSGDLSKVGTIINQLLLGGVLFKIRSFISALGKSTGSGGGLFATIKESFESLTGTLTTMQTKLKAGTLETIAIAVALLTASLVALSFINIANLTKALVAITVLFTELSVALKVVAKVAGSAGILQMAAIDVALNLLATAILILADAVAILSRFSWDQLAKGLSAIAILLIELTVAVKAMSSNTAGLITSTAAMLGIAIALNIMALAVKQLGGLDFGTLEKGVGSIAALLLIVTGFQKISGGEKLISSAASMLLIGAALNVMAAAIAKLGGLSLGNLAKGIGAVAATLLILVVAMNAMKGSFSGSVGLTIIAAGLLIISKAISSLGAESWSSIGHAMVALAGSLVILIAAITLASGSLGGAAALLVVAAALALLTPLLVTLGKLSWESLVKGLGALAAVFLIIGGAAALLTPVVPVLLLLGAGIALVGIGVLAAGAGVLLFATALGVLAVAVVAAGAAVLSLIKIFTQLPAVLIGGIANAIATIVTAIANMVAAIVDAFVKIFAAVLDAITKLAPKFAAAVDALVTAMVHIVTVDGPKVITAFLSIIQTILTKLATYLPKFAAAAIQIVVNMLNAIAGEIPKMAQAAVNLIVAFINAIGKSTVQVVAAAIKMTIDMINGIANEIRKDTPALQAAMRNLGSAIIQAMVAAIEGGLSAVVSAIGHVVSSAINEAKRLLDINSPSKVFMRMFKSVPEGAALGVTNNVGILTGAVQDAGNAAIKTMQDALSNISILMSDSLDLQPRITPVVDLSQARKGFSDLNNLTKPQIINAGASSSAAASISAANAAAAVQAGLIAAGGTSLQFTQNNYSPTALSPTDIYRQTKNQLSIVKGVLAGNANAG